MSNAAARQLEPEIEQRQPCDDADGDEDEPKRHDRPPRADVVARGRRDRAAITLTLSHARAASRQHAGAAGYT